MNEALAIAGGIIFSFSVLPYVRDILKGKTRPNVVTWFTWTLITSIATWAAFNQQEYRTALLTLMSTLATTVIVVLGIRQGVYKYTKFDFVCQVLAIAGVIAWQITDQASIAISAALLADFIGAMPMLRHIWLKPFEETWATFAIAIFGGTLTIISLDNFNIVSLGFPLYAIMLDMVIVTLIITRRTKAVVK